MYLLKNEDYYNVMWQVFTKDWKTKLPNLKSSIYKEFNGV